MKRKRGKQTIERNGFWGGKEILKRDTSEGDEVIGDRRENKTQKIRKLTLSVSSVPAGLRCSINQTYNGGTARRVLK